MNLNQNTLNIIFLFLFFRPKLFQENSSLKIRSAFSPTLHRIRMKSLDTRYYSLPKISRKCGTNFFFFTCFMHVRPPFRKDWAFEKSCPTIYSCSFNIRGWIRIWKIEQDDDSTVKTIRNWIFPFEASFPRKLIPRRMLNYFQER